jgi:hypothetical protein
VHVTAVYLHCRRCPRRRRRSARPCCCERARRVVHDLPTTALAVSRHQLPKTPSPRQAPVPLASKEELVRVLEPLLQRLLPPRLQRDAPGWCPT